MINAFIIFGTDVIDIWFRKIVFPSFLQENLHPFFLGNTGCGAIVALDIEAYKYFGELVSFGAFAIYSDTIR